MPNYTNEMRFALFTNDKAGNPKRPDYRGTCSIDGIEYKLSGWLRTTKDGKAMQYIAGQIEKAEPKQSAAPSGFPQAQQSQSEPQQPGPTEDVPF